MLNIKEELKNYKFIELEVEKEDEREESYGELNDLLHMFTKTYEKMGKEQYKTANGVEEILDILEENNEKSKEEQDTIKELKEREQSKDSEIKVMLSTLIGVADIFDYMNTFVLQKGSEILKTQFKLVEEQLVEKLSQSSITILGIEGVEFDTNLHKVIVVENYKDKPEGIILKVIRKGYMYKGELLRKAEIVINKRGNN